MTTQGPPTTKATKAKGKGKCGHHPRYTGANTPRAACPICWGMYLAQKYEMQIESFSAPKVAHMSEPRDVEAFITGLRNALIRSRETGGLYSAFAHLTGGATVQIEVQLGRGTK